MPGRIVRYYACGTEAGAASMVAALREQRKQNGWVGRVKTAKRLVRARNHRFTVYVAWVEEPGDVDESRAGSLPASQGTDPR